MIQKHKVVELIYCKSDFKNSLMGAEDTAKSFFDLETSLVNTFKKYSTKFKQLDEISWITDLNLIKYFKPNKGHTIKTIKQETSRATEHDGFGLTEESESETKTGFRDTETTQDFTKTRVDDIYKNKPCNEMSLAVHIESRFGTETNQSLYCKKINKFRRKEKIGDKSWKPWWNIF